MHKKNMDLSSVEANENFSETETKLFDDYKKLGEKVDTVISKIKDRKKNRKKN